MTNRRRMRPQRYAEPDEGRSGWAHFERVAPVELRFVEWCPDQFGQCGSGAVHGWRSDRRRIEEIRRRIKAVGP